MSRVEIGFSSLYGFANQADATLSVNDKWWFVDMEDVRLGNFSGIYATYEPDFWLLDGNYHFMPDTNKHSGLISATMTDGAGESIPHPTITVQFTEDHVTSGLNFVFGEATDDYPTTLIVTFYNSSNVVIQTNSYHPTDPTFSTSQAVAFFRKIEIQMINTSKGYRYQRLQYLEFDTIYKFGTSGLDPIKTCSIIEETNPLSLELPIDELNFTVMPINSTAFNIFSPTGIYAEIKEHQPVYVRAFVGNNSQFMGIFYLKQPKNGNNTEIDFSASDALDVLDLQQYHGWVDITGSGTTVADILADIFNGTNINYSVPSAVGAKIITGYIPICTRREALQRLAFAAQVYVSCSRVDGVKLNTTVLPSDVLTANVDYVINSGEEAVNALELKTLITGVDFIFEAWEDTTDPASVVYEATLNPGTYKITFDSPVFDIAITNGTMIFPTVGYEGAFTVEFSTAGGIVTIEAVPMITTKNHWLIESGIINNQKNTITIQNTVKKTDTSIGTYAQYCYNYLQQRYLHKAKLFQPVANISKLSNIALIDSLGGKKVKGSIEKMSIDLTGGFVVDAEIVGVIV